MNCVSAKTNSLTSSVVSESMRVNGSGFVVSSSHITIWRRGWYLCIEFKMICKEKGIWITLEIADIFWGMLVSCHRVMADTGGCRRMPEIFRDCRYFLESVGSCHRVMVDAGLCRRFSEIAVIAGDYWCLPK